MLRRCLESPHPCLACHAPAIGFSNAPNSANAGITIEYGTMLEIRSVQMLNDGRSMVETFGTHRFRILEKGLLDGVERIDDEESDFGEEEESDFEDNDEDEGTIDELTHAAGTRVEPQSHARDPSSTVSTASTSTDSSSPGRLLRRIASSFSTPPPTRSYRPSFDGPSTLELMDTCTTFLQELERGTAPWVVQRLNNAYGGSPAAAPFFDGMPFCNACKRHNKHSFLRSFIVTGYIVPSAHRYRSSHTIIIHPVIQFTPPLDLNGSYYETLRAPPSALEFSRFIHISRPVVIEGKISRAMPTRDRYLSPSSLAQGFELPALHQWSDDYLIRKMGTERSLSPSRLTGLRHPDLNYIMLADTLILRQARRRRHQGPRWPTLFCRTVCA
ncbi:LON-domain-containing protein [Salix suchowensis]|nr:LON-domain-containing protein [Salix suchowensis]